MKEGPKPLASTFKSLEELSKDSSRMTMAADLLSLREATAPESAMVLQAASDEFRRLHAELAVDLKQGGPGLKGELDARLLKFGDKDGEAAVLIESTIRRVASLAQSGRTVLCLSEKWMNALPNNKAGELIKALRSDEERNRGTNREYSVNFVSGEKR